MSDQNLNESGLTGVPLDTGAPMAAAPQIRPVTISENTSEVSMPAAAVPVEPARPVTVAKPVTETEAVAEKTPKSKPQTRKAGKTRTRSTENRRSDGKRSEGSRKSRFSRRQLIIALIVLILVFDIGALSVWFLGNNSGQNVPPNPDPYALIKGQIPPDGGNIVEYGYDSALTFANYPNLTIVNTSSLKPIENNLFKNSGPDGHQLLYDELIVNRVIKLNSDWVDYLNKGNTEVFSSVIAGSEADTKLREWGAGCLVAYHRLAIGEIRHTGKNYFIMTQASFTLTKSGELEVHDDIMIFKLVPDGSTMLITDFETIPYTPPPAVEEPVPNNENPEGQTSTEGEEGNEGMEGEPSEGGNPEENQQQGEQPQDGSQNTGANGDSG